MKFVGKTTLKELAAVPGAVPAEPMDVIRSHPAMHAVWSVLELDRTLTPTQKNVLWQDFVAAWNSGTADVGVCLYFGTSGKNVFKGKLSAKTGVVKSFVRPWESNAGDSLVLYLDAAGTVDYGIGAVQA